MSFSDPQKTKDWWALNGKNESKRKRFIILSAFPKIKCNYCGFDDWRALQVDHIEGGGNQERKSRSNSQKLLLISILKNPMKFQLLCANCNWIKRYQNNEMRKEKNLLINNL